MESTFFTWMFCPLSSDWAALLIRLAIGLALLPYAISKLSEARTPPKEFPKVPGLSPKTAFYIAMVAETVASLGVILGFCTRLAAFIGACNMGVATWKVHGKNWTATAMPYLFGFIAILLIGAGTFSLDYLFR